MSNKDRCGNCKHLLGMTISGSTGSVYKGYICVRDAHRLIAADGPYAPHLVRNPDWCKGRRDEGETNPIDIVQLNKIYEVLHYITVEDNNKWRGMYIDRIYALMHNDFFNPYIDISDIKEIISPTKEMVVWGVLLIILILAIILEY